MFLYIPTFHPINQTKPTKAFPNPSPLKKKPPPPLNHSFANENVLYRPTPVSALNADPPTRAAGKIVSQKSGVLEAARAVALLFTIITGIRGAECAPEPRNV